MTRLRAYRDGDLERVTNAVALLRAARKDLALAGASRAARKVGMALKSVEGARRHAMRLKWAFDRRYGG